MAELAGISRNEVSLIERGEVSCSLFIAARLADALGVGLETLAGPQAAATEAQVRIQGAIRNIPEADQERVASILDLVTKSTVPPPPASTHVPRRRSRAKPRRPKRTGS
jgi:transcriptional regulator with XRE-family HTH domain